MLNLLFAFLAAVLLGCPAVTAAKDETITKKVFFDIKMDGKPAGALPLLLTCHRPLHSTASRSVCKIHAADATDATDVQEGSS